MSDRELALQSIQDRIQELYAHVTKSIVLNEGVWAMNTLRDFEEALERAGGDLMMTLAVSVEFSKVYSVRGW